MGNRVKVLVEAIRTYRLILDNGNHLDIFQSFYVPSVSRNLISLSKLDTVGYSFKFGNGCLVCSNKIFLLVMVFFMMVCKN